MAKSKTQTYRGPGVRGDGGSGRPPNCNAASSPASKAALTSITGVCSCAASAASWSSLQSQRHSLRADECGDDWEEEGRVRRQAVALRASAFKSWAFFSSEPASSSARCHTGNPNRPGDDWVVWAALLSLSLIHISEPTRPY